MTDFKLSTNNTLSTYTAESNFDMVGSIQDFTAQLGIDKKDVSLRATQGKVSDYDGLPSQGLVITNKDSGESMYISLSKKLDGKDLATYAKDLQVGVWTTDSGEQRCVAFLEGTTSTSEEVTL